MFCFILIIPPLSSAQGYRCCSGLLNFFSISYHFLSLSLTSPLSLSFIWRAGLIHFTHLIFSREGHCPLPHTKPNSCLSLISYLSFTQGYHNASQPPVCSSHSFSILKKMTFSMDCQLLKTAPFCPSPKKICSVKRTDNTKRVFCLSAWAQETESDIDWMWGHFSLRAVQVHLCMAELFLSLQLLLSWLPTYCCKGTSCDLTVFTAL